jgi:hypothetical protein
VWTLSVGLVNENVSDGRVKDPVKLKLGREIEAGSRLSGTGAAFKRPADNRPVRKRVSRYML